MQHRLLALLVASALACASAEDRATAEPAMEELAPPDAFLATLRAHCGKAYEGTAVDPQSVDSAMAGARLVMHVRGCDDPDVLRIPFHVGDNRSRTWVLTRTADGIRLKHDHRHEDGSEDTVTQYGGDSRPDGSPSRQEFPADSFTAQLIPAARTNVWSIEVTRERFVYELRREGTDRRFRVEFDLTRPVEPPPPPWGADRPAETRG